MDIDVAKVFVYDAASRKSAFLRSSFLSSVPQTPESFESPVLATTTLETFLIRYD